MNLFHLLIPLAVLASANFPLDSAYPVSYVGTYASTLGFKGVSPYSEGDGYGYVIDDIGTISDDLLCYDYFAFLYNAANGNAGITSIDNGGGNWTINNASYLNLVNDLTVLAKIGSSSYFPYWDGGSALTSAHVIIPDTVRVRQFQVSLHVHGDYQYSTYWKHKVFKLSDVQSYTNDVISLNNLDGSYLVNSAYYINDHTNITVKQGYGIIFYHEYSGAVDRGNPEYYGYTVESLTGIVGDMPEDWGADNLLTLFGYMFVGMTSILSIVIFPGLTLGVALLFPVAFAALGLVFKLLG